MPGPDVHPAAPARALLRQDNLRMLGKLGVIAALMFGFGYTLVPVYRAICSELGINVLSIAERRAAGFAATCITDSRWSKCTCHRYASAMAIWQRWSPCF